jgi:hypothetical protein
VTREAPKAKEAEAAAAAAAAAHGQLVGAADAGGDVQRAAGGVPLPDAV